MLISSEAMSDFRRRGELGQALRWDGAPDAAAFAYPEAGVVADAEAGVGAVPLFSAATWHSGAIPLREISI